MEFDTAEPTLVFQSDHFQFAKTYAWTEIARGDAKRVRRNVGKNVRNKHGKSKHGNQTLKKHATNACGQLLMKLWTFLVKQQFSCKFHPSMPTSLHYHPQLMHFCSKISDIIENKLGLSCAKLRSSWLQAYSASD